MTPRDSARRFIETPAVQRAVTVVILINAVILGLQTSSWIVDRVGPLLQIIDRVALTIFVLEIGIKIYAYGRGFFRDPWSIFDFLVVGISLVPATGSLSVLRALRVLRVLRLVSAVPSMRRVVATLFAAVPGIASIVGLLVLVVYVAAVMATQLFAAASPDRFGTLGRSLWTLFQTMTGEGWPDVAQDVMATQPWAWVFFLVYILLSTFVVLNLFLAVMVGAAESVAREDAAEQHHVEEQTDAAILSELAALRSELRALRTSLGTPNADHTVDGAEPASEPGSELLETQGRPDGQQTVSRE